ncbi:MAG TPA: phosphoribosylformylglycinamidine cyclo-ligase [Candidatus Baltobacteraceae bacterium]|jgi:phosphoribosylformylglycinamidine cyclo-ligase|nr:phosphoribosylformylglycinamidine cyclo-ligase [Candidatus Baltobacteraceae bacterium]
MSHDSGTADAYAQAGVDIAAGNEAVARYKDLTKAWRHPGQLDAIGGFGGLFKMPGDENRALVASTDGVGTKILIAAELKVYDTVGADLVNHCVNDILVVNASPLFFLDYLAVGKLEPKVAAEIVSGCYEACRKNTCALLGGETAEMPGLYAHGHFDLAGTIVGVVETKDVPDPANVSPGDAIVGLPSRGLHTNGYTLARKLIPIDEYAQPFDGTTFGAALLAEHPSYYNDVRAIQRVATVKAMSHITGGGLLENVPRTLPPNVKAVFEQSRWPVPELFSELIRRGNLQHEERYRTFNMGIGYSLIVPFTQAQQAMAAAPGARVVGWIEKRADDEPQVTVHPARA